MGECYLVLSGLVVHSEHSGNRLAHNTNLGKLGGSTASYFSDAELYMYTNNYILKN